MTDDRLLSLQNRHAKLEEKITEENQRPHPDDLKVNELKREKLRIKEEMSGLST